MTVRKYFTLHSHENVSGIPNVFLPRFPVTVENHEDFEWNLIVYVFTSPTIHEHYCLMEDSCPVTVSYK